MDKYIFTKDMTEISGLGGEYEAECQKILKFACEWLEANPTKDPKFSSFKDVYGIIMDDNADAKELTDAICKMSPGISGAMMQACVCAAMYIKQNDWESYAIMKTHPEGEVGILRERLKDLEETNESLHKRLHETDMANFVRGNIIAARVLGWKQYPTGMNSQQQIWASDAEHAKQVGLGDSLNKLVDEAILGLMN